MRSLKCQRSVDHEFLALYAPFVDDPKAINLEASEIGKRLRAARNSAGYTLEAAAAALTMSGYEVGKATIGHWETGKRMIDAVPLRRLCRLYRVSADVVLLDGTPSWPFSIELHDAISKLRTEDLRHTENGIRSSLRMEALPPQPSAGKVKRL